MTALAEAQQTKSVRGKDKARFHGARAFPTPVSTPASMVPVSLMVTPDTMRVSADASL
jgi:hypothetical protein